MHHHEHRHVGDERNRRECLAGIERHRPVEKFIDALEAGRGHQQRVAVRLRLGDDVGADIAARARTILDDDRLAERLRELLAHRAGEHVDQPARRERRDHADRPVGVGLRECARTGADGEHDAERQRSRASP